MRSQFAPSEAHASTIRALANHMWGGREHPLYRQLRALPAAKMLLGQGRVLYRQSGAQEAWQGSTGSPQGNTTFIAQPKTSAIDKVLPPPMSAVGDTLQVIFSARKHSHFRCQELCIYNARSCGEIGVLCIKMSQWMCSEPKRLFGMMKLLRKFSGSA